MYGFQWRHFGAKYVDRDADYTGQGFDQLADVINKIKHKPTDRRIIMSAWNPAALHEMALPPCHLLYQFYVGRGALSAQLYIRSSDAFLGLPFNIASVALLVHMLAQQCDLQPGEVVVTLGDAHLYSNHGDQVETQLQRTPMALPRLELIRRPDSIYGYQFEDFQLIGYEPAAHIAAPVAI